MRISKKYQFNESQVNRIIEMAWEDRTPFDAIKAQFGIPEKDVIDLMRQELQLGAWKRWRARVQGRATKHAKKREQSISRFKCSRQKSISHNRIT